MIGVLKNIKKSFPKKKDKKDLERRINKFVSKLEKNIIKNDLEADVFVGGAWAKQTWLKDTDIDIFLRFENQAGIKKSALALDGIKHRVVHGSRDYYQSGIFEIVPILKVDDPKKAKNVTDASPFHVKFVNENLKDPDDVRLLKLFCKAIGVYGAETHVSGFSGYVLELLAIKYGSFENMIKQADKWEPKIEIDFGKRAKLTKHKKKSPIIIYDPTLPERNAAASLDYKSFSKFLFHARGFLRNPDEKYFKKTSMTKKKLVSRSRKRGTKLFTKTARIKGPRNIFLSKLKKKMKMIRSKTENQGFSIYDYGFFPRQKTVLIFFEMETWETSDKKVHYGPPVWVGKQYFEQFIKKWKNVYVKNSRLVTDVKRENNALEFLNNMVMEHEL